MDANQRRFNPSNSILSDDDSGFMIFDGTRNNTNNNSAFSSSSYSHSKPSALTTSNNNTNNTISTTSTSVSASSSQSSEKFETITRWLRKVFLQQQQHHPQVSIPAFEINERTIDVLYELARNCEERESEHRIRLEDMETKLREYKSESQRLESILSSLGVTPDNLSQSGSTSVNTLTSLALNLNLKNTKTTSYCMALYDVSAEYDSIVSSKEAVKKSSNELLDKTRKALEKFNELKRIKESFEKEKLANGAAMEEQKQAIAYMSSKAKEYETTLQNYQELLEQSGYCDEFSHSSLVQIADKINDIRAKAEPKLMKLQTYHELPPDIPLAKLKIEEAKRELAALEVKLEQSISQIELN